MSARKERRVELADVDCAHMLMTPSTKRPTPLTLREAASQLGVDFRALDRALWHWLGRAR